MSDACSPSSEETPVTETRTASANFARPANATPYTAGDLVANNATAGSVAPMRFDFPHGQPISLNNVKLTKSQASISNANFLLWLLTASPTVTNGDNGAIAGTFLATAICEPIAIDAIRLLTGGGAIGTSLFGGNRIILPPTCYGLLEAAAAYTPSSEEVFTVELRGSLR